MRKIPTVFERDPEDRAHVLPIWAPAAAWVRDGEGVATRKFDGTCTLLDDCGTWWARREVRPGRTAPPRFWHVETDEVTGKGFGWEPIEQSPFARFHAEALEHAKAGSPSLYGAGTYELIGPSINGNPEHSPWHALIRHGLHPVVAPRTYETLREQLLVHPWEGLVWHHPDGRMAKLKRRDLA